MAGTFIDEADVRKTLLQMSICRLSNRNDRNEGRFYNSGNLAQIPA